MTVPNSRRGAGRGGAHSFSKGGSASPPKGPGRAGPSALGLPRPRGPACGYTIFVLNKRKRSQTRSPLERRSPPLGRRSPAYSRSLLGNVVFCNKTVFRGPADQSSGHVQRRTCSEKGSSGARQQPEPRKPQLSGSRVAGRLNARWGRGGGVECVCEKGPQGHAHLPTLTRK